MSRRLLQIAVALSSVQALIGGGLYLYLGVSALSLFGGPPLPIHRGDPTWSRVDYMFRAMAGVWFGLGIMLGTRVRSIERQTTWFTLLNVCIFGMGVGRGLSLLEFEHVPQNSIGAMVAELAWPPILILWQRHVAKVHRAASVDSDGMSESSITV